MTCHIVPGSPFAKPHLGSLCGADWQGKYDGYVGLYLYVNKSLYTNHPGMCQDCITSIDPLDYLGAIVL